MGMFSRFRDNFREFSQDIKIITGKTPVEHIGLPSRRRFIAGGAVAVFGVAALGSYRLGEDLARALDGEEDEPDSTSPDRASGEAPESSARSGIALENAIQSNLPHLPPAKIREIAREYAHLSSALEYTSAAISAGIGYIFLSNPDIRKGLQEEKQWQMLAVPTIIGAVNAEFFSLDARDYYGSFEHIQKLCEQFDLLLFEGVILGKVLKKEAESRIFLSSVLPAVTVTLGSGTINRYMDERFPESLPENVEKTAPDEETRWIYDKDEDLPAPRGPWE